MRYARMFAALVALATACKNNPSAEESAPPEPPGEPEAVERQPEAPPEPEPEPEPSGPEVVRTVHPGFELHEVKVGDGVLLWLEHQKDPDMQRVFRSDLVGGEPEQLGSDGKYLGLVRAGMNAQVLVPEGVAELSEPGKQRMIDHWCNAVHGTDCYYLDEKAAVFRVSLSGGKPKRIAGPPPWAKDWGKKGWFKVATDGTTHFRGSWSPSVRGGERERRVEAFVPGSKKPLVFEVDFIDSMLAVHDGALYFRYWSPGRDGTSDVRRLRPEPGAEPERVFGGRDMSWVQFEGDRAYVLHRAGPKDNKVWLLARADPDSDAFETIVELPGLVLNQQISDGFFYYSDSRSIYRVPLQ